GTTFRVHLPASTDAESSPAAARVSLPPRGQGELLLVVDDEENIRETIRRTLAEHGYQVLVASDGAEGVALYASRRADVRIVVTDLEMPIMDGVMMIQVMQRMTPKLKAIVSSGVGSGG